MLHVVQGKHEAVKAMLAKDIRLIFIRGNVTDCSRRTFENISAFEYSLWALDKYMWAMMLQCIPQNKGAKITERLIAQYNRVKTIGVTYTLHGKAITENHFDFANTIIKELQTRADLMKAEETKETKDWDAIEKQSIEGVGGAETLLPMHVVYEYCGGEPFKLPRSRFSGCRPKPKFISQPRSSRMFFNDRTGKEEDWFAENSALGISFAIYKGQTRQARGMEFHYTAQSSTIVALTVLFQERTNDFANLKLRRKQR